MKHSLSIFATLAMTSMMASTAFGSWLAPSTNLDLSATAKAVSESEAEDVRITLLQLGSAASQVEFVKSVADEEIAHPDMSKLRERNDLVAGLKAEARDILTVFKASSDDSTKHALAREFVTINKFLTAYGFVSAADPVSAGGTVKANGLK